MKTPAGGSSESKIVLVAVAVFFTGLGLSFFKPITNNDSLFHIRFGQEFLSGHWNWRSPGHLGHFDSDSWGSTQLLSQLSMGWLENHFGLDSINVLYIALYTLTMSVLYFILRQGTTPLYSLLFLALPILGIYGWFTQRPALLQFLLVPLIFYIFWKHQEATRPPWISLAVLLPWTLIHGSWILGIYVVGIFSLYNLTWSVKRFVGDCAIALITLVAIVVGPAGPRALSSAFGLLSSSTDAPGTEWATANFFSINGFSLFATLSVALIVFLLAKPNKLELFLLAGFVGAFFTGGRAQPAMAVVLTIMAAWKLNEYRGNELVKKPQRDIFLLPVIGTVLTGIALFLPLNDSHEYFSSPMAAELAALPDGSGILSENTTAGTLSYSNPELDPYMLGYNDIYTSAEEEAYYKIFYSSAGWQEELTELEIPYAITHKGSSLGYNLELYGYKIIFEEDDYVLLEFPERD